jgi:PAP2 superfamily
MFHVATRSVTLGGLLLSVLLPCHADIVTDWNARAANIATAAQIGPLFGARVMAATQVAVFEAVQAIQPGAAARRLTLQAPAGASLDAAVAAANRAVLSKLTPSQQAAIDTAYQAAVAALPEGAARDGGIALGEQAAAGVLALCAQDGADAPQTYRPLTTPGAYVPTALPVVSHWPQRKPWLLASADQFRPGPPPALTSEQWARDYNEIKAIGGAKSERRSAEQTGIAKFWEGTAPTIYQAVVRSVATQPGRDVTANARLLATAAQAIDDALISVMDAKYHYAFWRPLTAIRNGDLDGNDATERDPGWTPFIDTPMHPEYPCAHCIVAASVGAVLQAEIGTGTTPLLSTTSPTAPGVTRSWTRVSDFVQEVSDARVWDGVHYRNSTEVGAAMGRKVGEWASSRAASSSASR